MRESRLVLLILLGLAFAVLYVPVEEVSTPASTEVEMDP